MPCLLVRRSSGLGQRRPKFRGMARLLVAEVPGRHAYSGVPPKCQDVWSELGPPSSTVAKGADTMLIHMRNPAASGADYFYSYHSRCAA